MDRGRVVPRYPTGAPAPCPAGARHERRRRAPRRRFDLASTDRGHRHFRRSGRGRRRPCRGLRANPDGRCANGRGGRRPRGLAGHRGARRRTRGAGNDACIRQPARRSHRCRRPVPRILLRRSRSRGSRGVQEWRGGSNVHRAVVCTRRGRSVASGPCRREPRSTVGVGCARGLHFRFGPVHQDVAPASALVSRGGCGGRPDARRDSPVYSVMEDAAAVSCAIAIRLSARRADRDAQRAETAHTRQVVS